MLFKKRIPREPTLAWYNENGKASLDAKLSFYKDQGLRQIYLSNLDLLPRGTRFVDLTKYLEWNHQFIQDEWGDDILVFFS